MKHLVALALACLPIVPGCGGDDDGSNGPPYHPVIDPARFSTTIDNEFFPLVPGTTFRYASTTADGTEDVVVTVTADTRVVDGVTCVVVHDVASTGGDTLEDTYDWYAQDDQGNVWYLGEDTTAYDEGAPSTEGSWEAGVGGAEPGITMLGDPQVGDPYRQEYLAGVAEDMGQVLAVGESVSVPAGDYDDCVRTKDWTPLEPDVVENKTFCRGVGQVLAVVVEGDAEREELVEITTE